MTGSSVQLPYDRLPLAARTRTRASAVMVPLDECGDIPAILSACVALLYRYSGQADIPLRVIWLSDNGDIASASFIAEASGDSTFERNAERLASRLARADVEPAGILDPPVEVNFAAADRSEAELQINVRTAARETCVSAEYDADLFDAATVGSMLAKLRVLLGAAINEATRAIADIDIFSAAEKQWFDDHCLGQKRDIVFVPVHHQFEACSEKYADKAAVRFESNELSYRELNERANRLAHCLLANGVASGKHVAVCIDPCLDVATALLAVLKTGGIYVAINPAHPEFRIRAVLEDTRPACVVTQSQHSHLFESERAVRICVDSVRGDFAGFATGDPDVDIQPTDAAYVFCTSGSTGTPKGVIATHANFQHFVEVARARYGITAGDVIPSVASYTFSISMFELMSPLSVGGMLRILSRDLVMSPARMVDMLQEVSLFHIGPSLLKNIIGYIADEVEDYSVFDNVRHASSGGDMVPAELLEAMRKIFRRAELFVIYGCSEISLMGCTWEITTCDVPRSYVGQPFANMRLLVLDDDGNQVPVGATGDVCFGGAGVVKGYLGRPDTEKRLFFERDGMRCYRTGDRGRLNLRGDLELLGRRDFQIQLRGMRIELAEIEYHLRLAPGVRDGVVAAKKRAGGEKTLIAYIVVTPGETFDADSVRANLLSRLPDYMVPSFYLELSELPLNHNLKIDRNALPDVPSSDATVENPPRTNTERALADNWCELLQRSAVGVDENFMALGGDSLLAMQMLLFVEKRFGCTIDGLEVLRESLGVIAVLIDERRGAIASSAPDRRDIITPIRPLDSFFFGPDDSLYGLYHHAMGSGKEHSQVLICPPIGYEYARCQFFLQMLAEALAGKGIASLRFDFLGMADSAGDSHQATLRRWEADIRDAYAELLRRSAGGKSVVLSLRLTSALAFRALQGETVDRWVCWDPVADGARHIQELRRMTKEEALKQLVVRNVRMPRVQPGHEELVGSTFARSAIEELANCRFQPDSDEVRRDKIRIVLTEPARIPYGDRYAVDAPCHWYDSRKATSAITSSTLLASLLSALTEETV